MATSLYNPSVVVVVTALYNHSIVGGVLFIIYNVLSTYAIIKIATITKFVCFVFSMGIKFN